VLLSDMDLISHGRSISEQDNLLSVNKTRRQISMSQLVPVSKWCPTADTLTLNNATVSSKQSCNITSSQGNEATSAGQKACRLCRNHRIHLLATRFLYPPLPRLHVVLLPCSCNEVQTKNRPPISEGGGTVVRWERWHTSSGGAVRRTCIFSGSV
jgi:hypothetical protein